MSREQQIKELVRDIFASLAVEPTWYEQAGVLVCHIDWPGPHGLLPGVANIVTSFMLLPQMVNSDAWRDYAKQQALAAAASHNHLVRANLLYALQKLGIDSERWLTFGEEAQAAFSEETQCP